MSLSSRQIIGAGVLLCLATHAPILYAQAPSCPESGPGSTLQLTGGLRQLPVDRISDLLALEPGVNARDDGDLDVRGAGPDALGFYLDGVPVTPGHRRASALLGGSYFGARGSGLGLGTNGFDHLRLTRGVGAAELGGGRGGVVEIASDGACAPARPVTAGFATDAILGKSNGLGFNRLTLDGAGNLGRLRLRGAVVAEGLESVRLGQDQNGSPIYVANGIDTTVTFTRGGQTVTEDVLRFRASDGIRIPRSANGSYTLNGRLGYELGGGHELAVSVFASQRQERQFDYEDLYNSAQTFADRAWTRGITGSWHGALRRSGPLQLRGEAYLSYQADRLVNSPLTAAEERDSRDPFGGFLLSPLAVRFDFDNFAVNDELVRNFRTNTGRRSPYDLNNTSQYQLIDQYRNNAYGLSAFSEAGGPVGLLTLSRENRLVGKGVLDATSGALGLRVGGEFTRYDVNFYESLLTSQANSNAYVESPKSLALFADGSYRVDQLRVDAGVRLDHFSSGASRPDFPRISSAPGFDPANPTAGFVADKGHSRVSPRVRATFEAMPALTVTGGIGTVAQQPDFADLYAGINTDLSTTLTTQRYGTDLDYEHATIYDIGGRYRLRQGWTVDAAISHREDKDLVALRTISEFDPARGATSDIARLVNAGSTKATALEARLHREFGARGEAWVGYTYTDTKLTGAVTTSAGSRPHVLQAALLYRTAPDSRLLAGILANTGVYGAVRVGSGTAYTRCPPATPENSGVLSGETCANGGSVGDYNSFRLPALKLVDLRVTRSFAFGRTTLTAFADARNLLNSRTITRVFAQTGKTTNPAERDALKAGSIAEFANEASANGVLQGDGSIDLTFGGAADPRGGCGAWTRGGVVSVPNCIYLIGAEERFGNGDHLFTVAEQGRAFEAYYNVNRGLQNFTGPGRRVRLGLEIGL